MASGPLATALRRKRTKKQDALSQDVLEAAIMTPVAFKNKQTSSSTAETATAVRVKRAASTAQTGRVQTDLTGPAGSDAGVLFSVNL